MPTTETLKSVTRDPTDFLDHDTLSEIVNRLQAELPPTELSPGSGSQGLLEAFKADEAKIPSGCPQENVEEVCLAAALHRFVRTRAEYGEKLNGGLNHPPTETLVNHGNCADQSLLLSALYSEADLPSRIVVVEHSQESQSHAFVEAGFELKPSDVIEILGVYYRVTDIIDSGQLFFDKDTTSYFIADPVASRFLGDRSGLKSMGYTGDNNELTVARRFTLYSDSSA